MSDGKITFTQNSLGYPDDQVLYGDAGYIGIEKRKEFQSDEHLRDMNYRINVKRSTYKNVLSSLNWQRYEEWQKSRVRSKVEYVFFIIKRIFDYRKVLFRGLEKNRTQVHILCASANLYMLALSGACGGS